MANRSKLVVVGVGKSGNIGRKIAGLHQYRCPAVLRQRRCLHGDLGILNDGDIVLALSFSGETDELIDYSRQ